MVRILACKSIGGIYSIGWEIRVLCYKKADESLSRGPECLPSEPVHSRFLPNFPNCPTKSRFEPSCRAEHYPSATCPDHAPSHEVCPGEAAGSAAGRGPGDGSPLRSRADHRSRKCRLRGRKPGQEFRRSRCP